MASKVYFWNLRASMKAPFELRMKRLLKQTKINDHFSTGDLVALKIHFGEKGVTGFLRPPWLKPIIDFIKKTGAKPFLTDASTLYVGERGEAVSHKMQAARHGFDPLILGAPVIIADGIKGQYQEEVEVNGKHFKSVFIAGDIAHADGFVSINHLKGHELAGFGGALKNIGMGCASKQGKMKQHMTTSPKVNIDHCKGCGSCVQVCASGALEMGADNTILMSDDKCVGCGACFMACKTGCLEIDWKTDVREFLERMMEYAAGVLRPRQKPCLHINFVMDVVPDCDCVGFTDAPLCPDIGVLASLDPVAVDQAGIDLVTKAQPLYPSKLPSGTEPGQNKFLAVHPHVPDDFGLAYAEELGLGSRKYKLITG